MSWLAKWGSLPEAPSISSQLACPACCSVLPLDCAVPTPTSTPCLPQLSKLLFAVGTLGLSRPRLLCALLPAAAAALDELDRAAQAGSLPPSTAHHLVRLAVALGRLQVSGQLEAAGIAAPAQLLPLWRQAMALLDAAASSASAAGRPAGGLEQQEARVCLRAAGQLNLGLAGGRAVFFVPPAVQRAVP